MKKLITPILLSALALTPLSAALQLEIDTTSKTFALTGSASGVADNSAGIGAISWLSTATAGGFGGILYDNDVAFSTTLGTPGGFARDFSFSSNANNGRIFVQLQISTPGQTTITGSGVFQDYSFLDAAGMADFEALIGEEVAPWEGTGFGVLTVVDVGANPIPEPSFIAVIGGAIALVLVVRRIRR